MKLLKTIILGLFVLISYDASAAYCTKSTNNYAEYVKCMHSWWSDKPILDKASYDAIKGIKEADVNVQPANNSDCEQQVKKLEDELNEYKELLKLQKEQIQFLKSRIETLEAEQK